MPENTPIKAKHTPGPQNEQTKWTFEEFCPPSGSSLGNKPWYEIYDLHGNKISECGELEHARLIASAPDLLEACRAVLDAINQADLQGTVLWINPPYQRAAVHESATERLHAAIAKAEGESNND